VVIGTGCMGSYIYIQLPYDHGGPNNSLKCPSATVKVYIVALWETHYHLSERH
jgi:hypothetical protein